MRHPTPRGPLGVAIREVLAEPADAPGGHALPALARRAAEAAPDVLTDDDVQLSLAVLQELHYRGVDGVDPDWEWSPALIATRRELERPTEAALRARTAARTRACLGTLPGRPAATDVARALFALTAGDDGPPLSTFMARRATVEQFREFLVHRSVYHLKEADPHTWAVPRLSGRPKAALVEVQADEYGGGRPDRMHSALFARTMRGLHLDDTYGTHLDRVPATTLVGVNAISMFGLQRRLRGAVAGHLAALEMTSSLPNRRYGNGLRRLGYDPDTTWFFDEHVEADAVHEQIAGLDLAGALVEDEPALLPDVVFGAVAALTLDAVAGAPLLAAWAEDRSSLRPGPGAPSAPRRAVA